MRVLTLFLICIVSISLQAQTFEEYISKGDKLYGEESYTKSGKEYDKAFALKEGSASQYYNAACSWALTEDTIQSIKYLQLSAEKGWKNLKHIGRDSDLKSLHNVSAWKGILEEVQVNQDEYEKDFDKPLKEQLEWVNVKDQMLRLLYRDAEEKFGKESEEMKYYWQLVSEQDSLNEIEVFKIIDEKGWVGRNLVGSQANTAIWLVIQHAALEVQEKYLPYLKESV